MRMKFNKSGQLVLVAAASLLAAGLITACGTLTVDFVFVASSKAAGPNNYGELDVFEVNSESGRMRQIPTSPFPSGGRNPVAEAVSTDHSNLYVVNQDDNTIVQFVIGNDGKLYPQNTVNTPGVFPLAVAVTSAYLYVVDTYQPLPTCSPAEPCSGSIAVYPIAAASSSAPGGQLGTPVANAALNASYWPLTLPCSPNDVLAPSAINVLASGKYVYVTAFDSTAAADDLATPAVANACDTASGAGSAPTGYVFGFAANSDGTLTPLAGSPFVAGALQAYSGGPTVVPQPSSIASDPTGGYVYVTDFNNGVVLGFSVASGSLTPLTSGTKGTNSFPAGNQPSAVVVDPGGGYAFVANSLDSTLTGYTIDNGALSRFGTFTTSTQPVALFIDPSTQHYIYTANFLGGTVSGFELNTGSAAPTLLNTQNTPYTANAQPTAMAGIPHGSMAK
jgi:6-phosphogluconolactonase (cycloisomerase 2 family)